MDLTTGGIGSLVELKAQDLRPGVGETGKEKCCGGSWKA